MKYIIDTDPGIDDSIAIMMGVKNKLDIVGLTLASGNIPQVKAEKNLKLVQEILNTNIKMYKGEPEKEVIKHETAEYAHGKDGLGYYVFPDISRKKYEKLKPEDFIIKASKKYKYDLTLVCFGSLVNLAKAIKKDKNLVKRLKHVIIMGTSYNPEEDPYIEFNVNASPQSAKLVLSSNFSDIKLITHEIGITAYVDRNYVINLRESDDILSRFISQISLKYMDFSGKKYKNDNLVCPDPATIASVIDPSLFTFRPCNVKVVDRGTKKGECYITLTDNSNIKVATDVDVKKFNKLFKETFK